ncbi:MAG: RNA polymerase sigma factor [Armatimonadota bacterium]
MDITTTIRHAATGDSEAFSQLVVRYRGLIYSICLNELRHTEAAEDLTQEVFIRMYRDLRKLRDPEKLLPWLRRVARNACRMWLRRQRLAEQPLETLGEAQDPAIAARRRQDELRDLLAAVLDAVSPKNREVLVLHYLAHCSEEEIALLLALKPATVKSRLYEGRQQAKRQLLPVVEELLSQQVSSAEIARQVLSRCGSPGCACPGILLERR